MNPRVETLPRHLTAELERRLGRTVAAVHPAPGVYASDFAAVLTLAGASAVFVKATRHRHRADYRTEAAVASALPRELATPRLRCWFERAGWIVLCFDAVAGAPPAQPWRPGNVAAVLASLAHRARLLTPSPLRALRGLPELMAGTGRFTVWRDLAAGRPRALSPDRPTPWQADHLHHLAEREARRASAVAGTSLLHFDPRADNYLIDAAGRARVVDWSRACLGAPWVDLATFLPSAATDGHDPERLFATHPAGADVPPDDLDAYLAALAGHWADVVHRPGRPVAAPTGAAVSPGSSGALRGSGP
ncbi:phosphotransferase [Actinosynnema sp. NPDC023587]|uniref:phosphotransferase n=1 Tax=Actinosynnema sp. NPDC023587 TaxID=3154695 RepID=UPI0033D9AC55